MNDRILAKIEESRARAAREAAAEKSQADYLAGRRDEFGKKVKPKPRPAAKAAPKPKRPRPALGSQIAYKVGDPCARCSRPMGPKRTETLVVYGGRGYCRSCMEKKGTEPRKPVRERCEDCNGLMRPRDGKAADYPDRLQRGTTQKCLHCYKPSVTPREPYVQPAEKKPNCVDCDVPLLEVGEAPKVGHRRRSARGMCHTCYNRYRRARNVQGH